MRILKLTMRFLLLITFLAIGDVAQAAQIGGVGEIKAWKLPATFAEASSEEVLALKGLSAIVSNFDAESPFDRQLAGVMVAPLRKYKTWDWSQHVSEVVQATEDARPCIESLVQAREKELKAAVLQPMHNFNEQKLKDAAAQMAKCRVFGGQIIGDSLRTVSGLANCGDLEKARAWAVALGLMQSVSPPVLAEEDPEPIMRQHGRLRPLGAHLNVGKIVRELTNELGGKLDKIKSAWVICDYDNRLEAFGAVAPDQAGEWRLAFDGRNFVEKVAGILKAHGLMFRRDPIRKGWIYTVSAFRPREKLNSSLQHFNVERIMRNLAQAVGGVAKNSGRDWSIKYDDELYGVSRLAPEEDGRWTFVLLEKSLFKRIKQVFKTSGLQFQVEVYPGGAYWRVFPFGKAP